MPTLCTLRTKEDVTEARAAHSLLKKANHKKRDCFRVLERTMSQIVYHLAGTLNQAGYIHVVAIPKARIPVRFCCTERGVPLFVI